MIDISALDNPIWNALTTGHRAIARLNGLAARYPSGMSTLVGLGEPTARAFEDLRPLVGDGEIVAFFAAPLVEVPAGWTLHLQRFIDQMICLEPIQEHPSRPMSLAADDVPDMLALTAATEPGPFSSRTIEMGNYYGVRSSDGRLAAMAGQRLSATSFREISAVCTDPAFRGKGYARSLVAYLVGQVQDTGKLAILHVKTENGAKALYEKLGFHVRRPVQLTVISKA